MKKINFTLTSVALVTLLAVDLSYFCSNNALLTQINASSSSSSSSSSSNSSNTSSSSSSSSSSGSSSSSSSDSNIDKQKEILLGQSLYVTGITGSVGGGVSIGMRITNELAFQLEGRIEVELKDEYQIICYPNGKCPCTTMDWNICVSSGCPEAGLVKC